MNNLYSWLFHYGLDGKWCAIPREKINEYFNNHECVGVIRSSELKTLMEIVNKIEKDNFFLNSIQ
jgi:hypothetical protein